MPSSQAPLQNEWEHMAWSAGLRRFRASDGTIYQLVIKLGLTGRYRSATLTDEHGETWTKTRADLLAPGGARFSLPSGEALSVVVSSGLEEELSIYLDGGACPFLPAKAMKLETFAQHVKRGGMHQIGVGVFSSLIALPTLGAAAYALSDDAIGVAALLAALGSAFALGAWNELGAGFDRAKGTSSRVMRVLTEAPDSIGWLYYRLTKGGLQLVKGGEYALIIHTMRGASHELDLPADAVEPAMRLFTKRAPRAEVGYTDEARNAFHRRRSG